MKSKPQITDEEIQRYMDFDKLLTESGKQVNVIRKRRRIKNVTLGVVSSVLLIISVLLFSEEKTPLQKTVGNKVVDNVKPTAPSIQEKPAVDNTPRNEELLNIKPKETNQEQGLPKKSKAIVPLKNESKDLIVQEDIYVQAEPLQGYSHLYQYLNDALVYPHQAVADSVEGVVTVNFTINKRGEAQEIKIINSLGPEFDKEVIRLMANMPAWKAATYNGNPVSSKISIPLTFEVKRIHIKK